MSFFLIRSPVRLPVPITQLCHGLPITGCNISPIQVVSRGSPMRVKNQRIQGPVDQGTRGDHRIGGTLNYVSSNFIFVQDHRCFFSRKLRCLRPTLIFLATIILQSSKHLPRFLWFQNLSEANGDCSKRRNQNNFAQTEQTVSDMENHNSSQLNH